MLRENWSMRSGQIIILFENISIRPELWTLKSFIGSNVDRGKFYTDYRFVTARMIQIGLNIMTYASIANHTRGECRKRIVIKSRDYRAWRTWHHCIVHVIEPVRVNNDRKFLCNQKTKTRADIRMYNRVNWTVRELYSMWLGSEKINNFKNIYIYIYM